MHYVLGIPNISVVISQRIVLLYTTIVSLLSLPVCTVVREVVKWIRL